MTQKIGLFESSQLYTVKRAYLVNYDPDGFNDDLSETLKMAGLPSSITAHSLRHTFTSLSAEAGATLEDIQKQFGHASDEMTKRV